MEKETKIKPEDMVRVAYPINDAQRAKIYKVLAVNEMEQRIYLSVPGQNGWFEAEQFQVATPADMIFSRLWYQKKRELQKPTV